MITLNTTLEYTASCGHRAYILITAANTDKGGSISECIFGYKICRFSDWTGKQYCSIRKLIYSHKSTNL